MPPGQRPLPGRPCSLRRRQTRVCACGRRGAQRPCSFARDADPTLDRRPGTPTASRTRRAHPGCHSARRRGPTSGERAAVSSARASMPGSTACSAPASASASAARPSSRIAALRRRADWLSARATCSASGCTQGAGRGRAPRARRSREGRASAGGAITGAWLQRGRAGGRGPAAGWCGPGARRAAPAAARCRPLPAPAAPGRGGARRAWSAGCRWRGR
jgi:hypothetical protein